MELTDIIARKSKGFVLSKDDIETVVRKTSDGTMDDELLTDFLKAVYENGMNLDETSYLTMSMTNSGFLFTWPDEWKDIVVDKHSTGGVGDKISLPLAPVLAVCGLKVPMIAGRGLAHTGGTLDKLESIPGFNVNLDKEMFKLQVESIGCAISGQTSEIAPADRRMYAIRDVTDTIDCLPLIVGSILSKKVAEGLGSLVLDIKVGNAAFMKNEERALKLAKLIVSSGENMGIRTKAVLTRMNNPIGNMIGNSLEIVETIQTLSGNGPKDTLELLYALGGGLLVSAKICNNMDDAKARIESTIEDGSALNKFKEMIQWQGGDSRVTEPDKMWQILGVANCITPIYSEKTGYIQKIDALKLGIISQKLGAGRINLGDTVKSKVGIELNKQVGDFVKSGELIAKIHSEEEICEEELKIFLSAIDFSESDVESIPRIIQIY